MNTENLLLLAINASIKAGKEICKVYNSTNFQIKRKQDNSPITLADRLSHKTIEQALKHTELPLLSEEGKNIPFQERKKWNMFWMVDPLDGTKEFIKRNDEFTVNIALIHKKLPILGVIYVPITRQLYFANENIGSYKATNITETIDNLQSLLSYSERLPSTFPQGGYIIVASRSHMNEQTRLYIEQKAAQCEDHQIVSIGSSLKFCLVAEGIAHEYPRFGPTMEWDTAAGHAIVKFSGGSILVYPDNHELVYNKPQLLNPFFIVKSSFLNQE